MMQAQSEQDERVRQLEQAARHMQRQLTDANLTAEQYARSKQQV